MVRRFLWSMALAGLCCAGARAEPIKIGTVPVGAFAALYVAQEKGYFKAAGVPAEIVKFDAAAPVAVAVTSGAIDFGVAAVTAAFYNLAGQGELKVIAAAAHEWPGFQLQALLVSRHAYDSGLKSLKDLPGHSFGVTGQGAPPVYVVGARLAEKYGFPFKSLTVVPLQTIPNIDTALTGGKVDFTSESLETGMAALIARGDVKLMGWVGDEAPWQFGVVFTATKSADGRGDTVRRFLEAYRRGAHEYHAEMTTPDGKRRSGPEIEPILQIIAKYTNQKVEDVKLGIPYMDEEARLDIADVQHQVNFYKAQGLVKPQVDAASIIDRRFVVAMPGE